MPAEALTPCSEECSPSEPAATAGGDRDLPAADAEVIVRRSGTSFYWGMRVLPPDKRAAMYAIYAFCREVDDIADEPAAPASKRERLQAWRLELDTLYGGQPHQGQPRLPVAKALKPAIAAFALRHEDLLAVVDGMEMDAAPRVRLASMADLAVYCDRVACAVGRLSVRVFGLPQPEGDALADALGRALQLTNILRDVKDDAGRDRLYLPAELLARHAISDVENVDDVLRQPTLAAALAELAGLAEDAFGRARRIIAACERRAARPATIMLEVYHRMLKRLMQRGWERWAEPVSLSAPEKLWIALRFGVI